MNTAKGNFWDKIGLPSVLIWGYVGVILFMLGSGLEQSWFSAYLVNHGLTTTQAGTIFTAYGIVVAIASWLSGVSVSIWGVRKVMWVGMAAFLSVSIPFTAFAVPSGNFAFILLTYMIRGLGYPLFCFSFMVWIAERSDKDILARANSWFWICYNVGLTIIGPWVAAYMIPVVGEIWVLWTGIVIAVIGVVCALIINKDQLVMKKSDQSPVVELRDGILIMFRRPRLGVSVIVKTINGLGNFAFVVLLPIYLIRHGFSMKEWASIWSATYISNQIFNVVFGYIGDKIGWRKTVMLFGGGIAGISTLLIYYSPLLFGHNYWIFFGAMCLFGAGLAGFVPLSALVPMMAPDQKGAAISALNLGSGLSNFVGPLLITLLVASLGTRGVLFIIAALYFISVVLTYFLKTPEELTVTQSLPMEEAN